MVKESRTVARQVIYSGRVQGVGFRWTATRIAQGFEVAGFVRNCSDGTVELFVQGPDGEVEAMLEQLAETMSGHIEKSDHSDQSVQSDLSSFSVRR